MDGTALILVLYIGGIAAMAVEMFVPGGIIGTAGFLALCGSIVYAYASGHGTLGTVLVVLTIALAPLFFVIWKSVLSRFFALRVSEAGYSSSSLPGELAGKEGVATSHLRPSGTAAIDGKRYSVITRGEMLEKGARIEVLEVSGNRVVVRQA